MAEGRMLKRNISESRRLSQLKTDSARLLWTWIIPFLDSEGRFYASADMIKGKIVPRLSSFTLKNIPKYIEDMARVGLIILYEVDGEKLIQYRKFDTFQKIVKTREAAPLPPPTDQDLIRSQSGLDQDKVESESRLPCPNLREVNLREEKEEDADAPVDNSKPEKKKISLNDKDLMSIENLSQALYDDKIFPHVHAFKNLCLKNKVNLRALIKTLTSCYTHKPRDSWPYCVNIMKTENGNFNEQEYIQAAKELEKGKPPPEIAALIQNIGSGGTQEVIDEMDAAVKGTAT